MTRMLQEGVFASLTLLGPFRSKTRKLNLKPCTNISEIIFRIQCESLQTGVILTHKISKAAKIDNI